MRAADATNLNWKTQPNEEITVSETHDTTMPGVNFTLDEANIPTPNKTFQMGSSGQRFFTVTAHFSGTDGEKCVTQVSGDGGGSSRKTIRQPTSASFAQLNFKFEVETA
jgi:hypothetical protein